MKKITGAAVWMVLFLLAGSQCPRAEPARQSPKPTASAPGERREQIQVDEVVAIAVGHKAVANTQIGSRSVQAAGNRHVTVRVGKVQQRAVGPNASVCVQIPFLAGQSVCE